MTLFSLDPSPVEQTDSIGIAVSEETEEVLHTHSVTDLSSSTLVYVWILANGSMDTTLNGGIAMVLGDGTDTIGYHLAGSDIAAFRHESGPVGWQCLLTDTGALPTDTTDIRGQVSTITLTDITEFGAMFKTLSKALGGAENCFIDTIRYGNQGIEITAGNSGTPSNWTDIAAEDRSTSATTAYGICREIGAGLFSLQGALTFGDAGDTTSTFFADTNKTIVFEDRNIGITKYSITIRAGGVTGDTTFRMGTLSGSDEGVDGCTFICPVGVGASFNATNTTLQSLLLYGTSFTNFDQGMLFSADGTNGPNHDVFSCTFTGCSQIDPGLVVFKNNTIAATTDADGGLLLDGDGSDDWSDLSFISDGTGHAIEITVTGTYAFVRFTYSGYSEASPGSNQNPSTGSTDAKVFNNSGGAVTINVTAGDPVTVRNAASSTTTVNNNVAVDVHIQDNLTDPIQDAVVAIFNSADDSELVNELTDASGNIGQASISDGTALYIRVRKSSTGTRYFPIETVTTLSGAVTLTITMTEDTIA